jgi:hypothetical protein
MTGERSYGFILPKIYGGPAVAGFSSLLGYHFTEIPKNLILMVKNFNVMVKNFNVMSWSKILLLRAQAILRATRRCWQQNPNDRPKAYVIRDDLRTVMDILKHEQPNREP